MFQPAASESPLPWHHPAFLIATVFGAGRIPKAPGTWGSLAALPPAWWLLQAWGPVGLLIASIVVFPIGWWAAKVYAERAGISDPGAVVIDEVAGQWIALLPLGAVGLPQFAAGFALFRLFDILKPWPVSWADRQIKGGLGIMVDDVLAGLYAAAVLWGGQLVLGMM